MVELKRLVLWVSFKDLSITQCLHHSAISSIYLWDYHISPILKVDCRIFFQNLRLQKDLGWQIFTHNLWALFVVRWQISSQSLQSPLL